MSESRLKILIQAEQLMNEGKLSEAYQIVKDFEEKKWPTPIERLICHHLRTTLLNALGEYEEALKLSERAIKEAKNLGESTQEFDVSIAKAEALWRLGRLDESLEVLTQSDQLLQNLTREGFAKAGRGKLSLLQKPLETLKSTRKEPVEVVHRRATLTHHRGLVQSLKGNLNSALENLEQSLALFEELDSKQDVAIVLNSLGILYQRRGELDRALEYWQQSIVLNEKLNNTQNIALTLNNLGLIFHQRGELDRALEYWQQSLVYFEELDNKPGIALLLNNIGENYKQKGDLDRALNYYQRSLALNQEINNKQLIAVCFNNFGTIYHQKGDLNRALDYLKQSLALREEIGSNLEISDTLFHLISVAGDMGSLEKMQSYLEQLQDINDQEENKIIRQRYRIAEVFMLKTSARMRDKVKAQDLLKQVIAEEVVEHELTVIALLNLCDLLLGELRMTGDKEILHELQGLVNKVTDIAEKQHSYSLLVETYLLKAKLALLDQDFQEAQRLLTQAQLNAENKSLFMLAKKISNEHDIMLEQLSQWEVLKQQNAHLTEGVDLVRLDEQIARMIQQSEVDVQELPEEEPVMVLILTGGGTSLFSKYFSSKNEVDDQLFSGFLTAIQAFGKELFAQNLDRIKLEAYTLLLKLEEPFTLCYVFKGQSYSAQQKLARFIHILRTSTSVWESLLKFSDRHQLLDETMSDSLERLLKKAFFSEDEERVGNS
ncbi:MAG: tetratricopeptide repeat protein [Candidatus Hermodarchaeota archaeon]